MKSSYLHKNLIENQIIIPFLNTSQAKNANTFVKHFSKQVLEKQTKRLKFTLKVKQSWKDYRSLCVEDKKHGKRIKRGPEVEPSVHVKKLFLDWKGKCYR